MSSANSPITDLAAVYDQEMLRARHAKVTAIDILLYREGKPPRRLDLAGPIESVYFLCQPDEYGISSSLLQPADFARA